MKKIIITTGILIVISQIVFFSCMNYKENDSGNETEYAVEWRQERIETPAPDGTMFYTTVTYPVFTDHVGDKTGCTDQNAVNYCGDCTVACSSCCIYLASPSGGTK